MVHCPTLAWSDSKLKNKEKIEDESEYKMGKAGKFISQASQSF